MADQPPLLSVPLHLPPVVPAEHSREASDDVAFRQHERGPREVRPAPSQSPKQTPRSRAVRQGAVPADGDQRVETGVVEATDELVGPVDLREDPVGLADREAERIAAVGRADDRATEMRDPGHRFLGQRNDAAVGILLGQQ